MISKLLKIGSIAAIFAAIFLAYSNAQNIEDWFRLRNYTPPAAIAAFARDDSMTPSAERIFYVTHPTLETNLQTFQQSCANSEQTIVLGCYRSGISADSNIVIREINDERLQGVEQVTAAHEMLHAAYDRLNTKNKQKINALLVDYYNNQLKDQRIKDTIDNYKKTEPTELVNEMHSIFATEIIELPEALENYYKQYFIDRSKVTAFSANYEAEFNSRKNQIETADQKLNILKNQIDFLKQEIDQQGNELQKEKNRAVNSNDASQIDAYNNRVNQYNAIVRRTQTLIAEFNALLEERNTIFKELDSLRQSLDSRIDTKPTQ